MLVSLNIYINVKDKICIGLAKLHKAILKIVDYVVNLIKYLLVINIYNE